MIDELVERLKEIEVVVRRPVELKHAGQSRFYIDIKKALGYPDVRRLIRDRLWTLMPSGVTCVAGSGHGGIPIATAISDKYNLNLVLVRDRPKGRGLDAAIDGYVPGSHDAVAIVDDVHTTGGSIREMERALKTAGAQVVGAYVVVNRGEPVPGIEYLLKASDLTG